LASFFQNPLFQKRWVRFAKRLSPAAAITLQDAPSLQAVK
jgi:hypothetical protein